MPSPPAHKGPRKKGGTAGLLATKWGPAPVYVWAGGLLLVALLWNRYQSGKSGTTAQQGAAAQNSQMSGYANEPQGTAPQFIIQNQIPSSPGGAPVVTPPGTTTSPPTTTPPTSPYTPGQGAVTINVGKGQTVTGVLNELHTKGYPDLNWSDIWAWNPKLIPDFGLSQIGNGDWQFTQYSTPLVINQPGTFFDTKISGDVK